MIIGPELSLKDCGDEGVNGSLADSMAQLMPKLNIFHSLAPY